MSVFRRASLIMPQTRLSKDNYIENPRSKVLPIAFQQDILLPVISNLAVILKYDIFAYMSTSRHFCSRANTRLWSKLLKPFWISRG